MPKGPSLLQFFNEKVKAYNQPSFIPADPICIPHLFSKPADIEIAGFFAAIFAWGNRTTIVQKSKELMQLMDGAPHQFVLQHQPKDLQRLAHFKHRTFQADDLFYFLHFLQQHYRQHASLEAAFAQGMQPADETVEKGLIYFKQYFFSYDHLRRTQKHISSPATHSSCKRLNMYLRWMVRQDNAGVDFGLWKRIRPSQLVCPLDVHVARVAKRFNLLQRRYTDWEAALELTSYLRKLDASDPVKYDFALFGLGVIEKYT